MKNKVTIIVPVYNAKKYIKRCIESILKQTYENFELLLINDGSKDNSIKILNDYLKKDKRIKVIDKENEGVAKTRNLGIKKATGKYIMFIDNDDYIDPDYVETYIKIAIDNNSDVVMGGYKRPNSQGNIIKEVILKDGKLKKEMIYKICAPWAKIYNKKYILDNEIEFLDSNLGEDNYFNLQALIISDKITTTKYNGYNWFYNDESVSNTTQKAFEKSDIFKLLNNSYEVMQNKKLFEKNYDYIEFYLYLYIIWFLCFSQRKYNFKTISKNYDKLFEWLSSKFPNYKKNKFIGFNKPQDEDFKYKVFFGIFKLCNNLKVGKLLIYLYTRI